MLNEDFFWSFIEIISLLIEWGSFYLISSKFSLKRIEGKWDKIFLVSIIGVSLLLKILNIDPNERIIICFILGLIYYNLIFKVNFIKALMISLTFWLFMLTIEAISISFIVKINNLNNLTMLLGRNLYRLETMILSKAILISLIIIVRAFKTPFDIGKEEILYILTPIFTNIIIILTIFGYAFREGNNDYGERSPIFFVSILMLLSNLSLMFIARKIIKNKKLELENQFIKDKLEMEYNYYSNLRDNEEKIRRLYHDIKNHIACIHGSHRESNKREKYINSLKLEIDKLNLGFNTGNEVLDVILNNKSEVCKDYYIDLKVFMDFSKVNFMEYFDICTIFANCIDNAIEACRKVKNKEERYISLKGNYINNFYVVKIENSKINKKNNKLITDKKDKFLHGLGLKNIKLALEKYEGELIIEDLGKKFILKMLLPMKQEKEA